MSATFEYLLDKIWSAPFSTEPFRHLEIRNFLSPEHFSELSRDPQIRLPPVDRTESLIAQLGEAGYEVIDFPGCVSSPAQYLWWLNSGSKRHVHAATEGFGIVYRLAERRGELLADLNEFMCLNDFKSVLVDKFKIERSVAIDWGIQKYLHGYEISPHPDIRAKALTWMLNLNPADGSEDLDIHTHYLKLKKEWAFITEFWKGNPEFERDWLPWSWCDTVKQQRENNSIVVFSPTNETFHAVKANYDHLSTQRTQLYGNLWYEREELPKVDFRRFNIAGEIQGALQRAAETPAMMLQLKRFYWSQRGRLRNLRADIESLMHRGGGVAQ